MQMQIHLQLKSFLRERTMKRKTKQRTAILKSLTENKRPLGIEEILTLASRDIPEINLSTVYRNLKNLYAEGEVTIVELPGENVRYELVEQAHHHHFHCQECDKLFKLYGCPEGLSRLVPEGFRLVDHSIVLNGVCAECH